MDVLGLFPHFGQLAHLLSLLPDLFFGWCVELSQICDCRGCLVLGSPLADPVLQIVEILHAISLRRVQPPCSVENDLIQQLALDVVLLAALEHDYLLVGGLRDPRVALVALYVRNAPILDDVPLFVLSLANSLLLHISLDVALLLLPDYPFESIFLVNTLIDFPLYLGSPPVGVRLVLHGFDETLECGQLRFHLDLVLGASGCHRLIVLLFSATG